MMACNKAPATNTCTSDTDCRLPGTRCDLASKRCVCKNDEACPTGQFCNGAGVCQARAGCETNADCASGTFCNIMTGKCLAGPAQQLGSMCGLADTCPYETICTMGTCVAGCHDDGDCLLGHICMSGECVSGNGLCSANGFCDYGQRCVGSMCQVDRRGPYCRGCMQATITNPTPCDAPRNFCLVNDLEPAGFKEFCGVDCSLGQPCPNGYDCNGVIILTQDVCGQDVDCVCSDRSKISLSTKTCTVSSPCDPRNPDGTPNTMATGCNYPAYVDCNTGTTAPSSFCFVARGLTAGSCGCKTNADCPNAGTCVSGFCCGAPVGDPRKCDVGEGRTSGFCECATDDDCPRDSCDSSSDTCAITGRPCTPGSNDCGPIACMMGGCLIGQNCAPKKGLGCSVVGGQ
jgi:hypothetical protein